MKSVFRSHVLLTGMMMVPHLVAAPVTVEQAEVLSDAVAPIMLIAGSSCRFGAIDGPLDLLEAVERALCNSPQTRQAWAEVQLRTAQVDVSRAPFWPTLSAVASSTQSNITTIDDVTNNSYKSRTNPSDYALNLNWTLVDFGLRRANLDAARQLLGAANASQDATLQTVFMTAAQAYYELLSMQVALVASTETEQSARQSFIAADAKYQAGAGALADKLQAQTTFAQATLDRVKSSGDLNSAHGALSIAMGMEVNTSYILVDDKQTLPNTAFVQSVNALLDDAKRHHPSLLAAQAQVQVAEAGVRAAKAEQWPTVSLNAALDRSKQTVQPPSNIFTHNNSIGIQVTIPLFDGFGRQSRVRAARAQVDAKSADLAQTEQQVAFEVWKSYQSLATEIANLQATVDLLESATQSFNVAQGRYKAGVGTIIELLNAQSALANAKQQRIRALSNWRVARLRLAASLGKLGLWTIR